ncbi:Arc18p SCDLUD_004219 [Saccharomycodes ludwigii]|uniref:Arc18p n=1 Tax=Saccharomycodes ludwigii TaxID=36035 RepID=UPI001E8A58E3|nr:hypothetical protein SCDLUD_004219 [Saccharomycodes ludwigii]KAH3899907.1 hypothetical protein SCDLUD_004219 [Saccharomycodes ludwigii]
MDYNEAVKVLTNLSLDNFKVPGEGGFPLNNIYSVPLQDRNAMELLRSYLQQFRQELSMRLLQRVYWDSNLQQVKTGAGNYPSKFWLAFTRRKFMNKSL